MYFLFSKCAVIIFWHLQLLVWQDFLQKRSIGLLKGYIAAVLARGAFHALGGIFVLDGLHGPITSRNSLTAIYPIAYNYSFLLAEAAITLVIICIPAVAKGLGKVKQIAAE